MASEADIHSTPEPFDQAIAVRVAGMSHQQVGDYRAAMTCFSAAREIFIRLDIPSQVAWTLQNEGLVLELLGRHDEAIVAFTQAETVFRASNERRGWPLMYRRRGDVMRRQGRHEAALAEYDAALTQYRLDDDANGIINALSSRAECALARQDDQRARDDLQDALAHLRRAPRRAGEYDFLLIARLARAEAALANHEIARAHVAQARSLARDLHLAQDLSNPDVGENLRRLAELEL